MTRAPRLPAAPHDASSRAVSPLGAPRSFAIQRNVISFPAQRDASRLAAPYRRSPPGAAPQGIATSFIPSQFAQRHSAPWPVLTA